MCDLYFNLTIVQGLQNAQPSRFTYLALTSLRASKSYTQTDNIYILNSHSMFLRLDL